MSVKFENITVKAGSKTLVSKASLELRPKELTALIGPNGAGKTSLIRAGLGLMKAASGTASIHGKNIAQMQPDKRARHIAYLPQIRPLAWPNHVYDIVALGRFAYGTNIGRLSMADQDAVQSAMQACDILHLSERKADTLSGGELARMHCARALCAKAPFLIADEPIAALDPRHQFRIMDLLRSYVDSGGGAIIVLHDIALATRYADQLVWMKDGDIIANGSVEDTLSTQMMSKVFGVEAKIKGRKIEILGAQE